MKSAIATALFLVIGVMGMSAARQTTSGIIRISSDDLGDDTVLVTVLRAGAILKSSDCTASQMIEWENIPEGDYEVKFEAAGKQTLVKKIHVGAGDATILSAKLPTGKGVIALGGGPSIGELDARLKRLEAVLVRPPAKAQKK